MLIKLAIVLTKKVTGCIVMFMFSKYFFVETVEKRIHFSNYTFKILNRFMKKMCGSYINEGLPITSELFRGYRNKCIWLTGTVAQELT